MNQIWRGLSLVGLLASVGRPLTGQVAEIQLRPIDLTMQVGAAETFMATPFGARGNVIPTSDIRWRSSNIDVIVVEVEPSAPYLVTVHAVGVGLAGVEVIIGAATAFSVVQVQAPPNEPPPLVDASSTPPDVVPPFDVSSSGVSPRIELQIFGSTQPCRIGGFIAPDMLLTSYFGDPRCR